MSKRSWVFCPPSRTICLPDGALVRIVTHPPYDELTAAARRFYDDPVKFNLLRFPEVHMDYRIEHAQTDEILRVNIFGVANETNADSIAQDIFAIVDRNDATRLLVDVRNLRGRLGPADMYWHVQKYPAYAARVKVAIVDRQENRPFASLHETLTKNRGYDIQYFFELADAEQWLDA